MEIGNYKKNPLKVPMCLWGGVERKAFCVLCLQAGGFQNEVLLSSGRRLMSEKVASVLADAIFEDCWPHVELERVFQGSCFHTMALLYIWLDKNFK